MAIVKWCILFTLYFVLFHDSPVVANDKRLILNDPDVLEARLHQMDLSMQNMRSQIALSDNVIENLHNVITVMQSSINGLKQEIQVKEDQIGNLTATVTSLQQNDQRKDSQIGSLTATVTSLQQKVNVPKPGCQTGRFYRGNPNTFSSEYESFTFNPPFSETPKLVWGTTALDVDESHNLRIRAEVQSLTQIGFVMHISTWADTAVLFHDASVEAGGKRLIFNDPDILEARLNQMDLTIQNLNSKIAAYDNIVAGMQVNINGLRHETQIKDNIIGNLTATVTSLQLKDQTKDSQIGSFSATVTSLKQKVNAQSPGCQTGQFIAKAGPLMDIFPILNSEQYETFTFNPPFTVTPKIVWGSTKLDFNKDMNLRFEVDVQSLTQYGFTMRFITWANTEGFQAWIQWMACL